MTTCRLCQDGVKPTVIDRNRPGLSRCAECGRDVTLAVASIRAAEACANAALQLSWGRRNRKPRVCA